MSLPPYAELHCRSNFSFLTGASRPEELVMRAVELGYSALAITDECSLAGVVRAHIEAKAQKLHLIVGSEMRLTLPETTGVGAPHARLVLLAQSRRGYGNLSHWITVARRRAEKGSYLAHPGDVEGKVPNAPMLAGLPGCFALLVPSAEQPFEDVFAHAMWLKTWFQERAAIALELLHRAGDDDLVDTVHRVAGFTGLPIVAAGDVLMHVRSRKPLQDTLTATRLGIPVAECGQRLAANAEQHLRSRGRLAALYEPAWLEQTLAVAGTCAFSLDELRYEYPQEIVPPGETPTSHLRKLTYAGVPVRFPNGLPDEYRQTIEAELALIEQLKYEAYFLTVADIVHWARDQKILCQGRGSAANSLVCYCLGVTEVDPRRATLLFGRFISAERNEPPDIDIDFEHQRREEVIQYIYGKYGRHRAALTAVVISYRPRSAVRDVGRALGIDLQRVDALAKSHHWFDGRAISDASLRDNGFDPQAPLVRLWVELTGELIGFPRHLSQHPGGFVIAKERMSELVPVENAAMPDRSVIQWDKDDLDALGLLKVDILAIGMLSAIRRALGHVGEKAGTGPLRMQDIPDGDTATYDMICAADTVGVFQIESRAQMSMLPRLRPRCYYDLVVEVAIVRPGPIQGGMVHPYLKNRTIADEDVDCPEELKPALLRTKGVPIFQEQVMQIAMLAADFTAGEADALRRAMAAWRRRGGLGPFHERLVGRMVEKGYSRDYAERIFKQIEGFGEYGFPESHAAGFALLAYVSSWIKCHHPDAFLAGLLNSQPMGFYAPAQLVRDAREHGVEVRPVDVCISGWESVLEIEATEPAGGEPALPDGSCGRRSEAPARSDGRSAAPRSAAARSAAGSAAARRTAAHSSAVPSGTSRVACTRLPAAASPDIAVPGAQPASAGAASSNSAASRTLYPVRLGLGRINGLAKEVAERIVAARAEAPFASVEDLAQRARLDAHDLAALASADALRQIGGNRHQAAWAVAGIDTRPTRMLRDTRVDEAPVALAAPSAAESTLADYRSVGLTLNRHPVGLLREQLARFRVQPAATLRTYPSGRLARASGLVTHRQRPDTAKGTVFVTLEDETGAVNVIVWARIAEEQRKPLLGASLLTVYGQWQCQGEGDQAVMHLIATRLMDHSALLRGLATKSRDFR